MALVRVLELIPRRIASSRLRSSVLVGQKISYFHNTSRRLDRKVFTNQDISIHQQNHKRWAISFLLIGGGLTAYFVSMYNSSAVECESVVEKDNQTVC